MSSATITAKVGPAQQLTAGVFTNVTEANFFMTGEILRIMTNGRLLDFELTGSNTITLTASGGTYTLTVS